MIGKVNKKFTGIISNNKKNVIQEKKTTDDNMKLDDASKIKLKSILIWIRNSLINLYRI